MATSQNGWSVIFSDDGTNLEKIDFIIGKVRAGDVAVIMNYIVNEIDSHVEDVDEGRDDWGWNVRPIRGQTSGYSNHSSATAIDVNAMQHPRGRSGTFTADQVAGIRVILKFLDGVIRWGGDYNPALSKVDEMHFEVNAGAAAVHAVAEKIRGNVTVTIDPKPKPEAKEYPDADLPITRKHTADSDHAWRLLMAAIGHPDKDLGLALQKWLRGLGYYSRRYALDGDFGYYSVCALQRFLKAKGLYRYGIDGKRGPDTVGAEIRYLNDQRKYL